MRQLAFRTIMIGLVLFGAIQLVRPAKTNPAVDPDATLQARLPASHPAIPVIARACQDCHSSETTWPWYSHVAPVSWLVAHDVTEARTAVNFSDWSMYGVERQRKILKESCEEAKERDMPLPAYVLVHRGARLTADDVRAICDLARTD